MKNDTKPDNQERPLPAIQLQQDYDTLAHEYRLLSAKYERVKNTLLAVTQEVKAQS